MNDFGEMILAASREHFLLWGLWIKNSVRLSRHTYLKCPLVQTHRTHTVHPNNTVIEYRERERKRLAALVFTAIICTHRLVALNNNNINNIDNDKKKR